MDRGGHVDGHRRRAGGRLHLKGRVLFGREQCDGGVVVSNVEDKTPNKKNGIKVLILATSLDPDSRSQIVAREAQRRLSGAGVENVLADLREIPLPLAGSSESWSADGVQTLMEKAAGATHVLFAVPIYNYDVNAAAKNAVELLGGDVFEGRTVGFICTAGGRGSYMSVMSFANSLMLDFRSWILPRFLYITEDVSRGLSSETSARLDQLLRDFTAPRPGVELAVPSI